LDIISLFSGAGGLDLGLIQSGHSIIWANDIDRDCVETYRKNLGSHIVCSDIADIDLETIPSADVVVGGFPCQGFSQANLRRSVSDDRNKLYTYFLKVIQKKKPMYFLAENVRGILSLDNGKVIERIISDFSRLGYRVKYMCFNVADFGVPQSRFRVIISGTRRNLPSKCEYVYPEPTHASRVKLIAGLHPWVSISEALSGIPEPGEDNRLKNHICSKYKVTNRDFTGHRRTNPDNPSPTILARGNGKGGVCAIQHPRNHRRLTIRESALIQTFPLDFEFVGSMNSCYRQVGNAVPLLFAWHLGIKLREAGEVYRKCV
jgi:DNA (cytosine-5)-methyltransferase 1